MRRVLVISFFYPPFNTIGGLRVSKMTRYLAELGWDVRVVTTDSDDTAADLPVEIDERAIVRAHGFDVNALPKRIIGSGRIGRYGYEVPGALRPLRTLGEIYRNLTNFPDGQVGWYRPAVRAARKLVTTWRPDVVFSSLYPATSHLVAHAIAADSGLPWVCEYRDPWTDSRSRRRAGPLYRLERWLEDRTVSAASAIVTVSDSWGEELARRFRRVPVHIIPNGYDASDYPADVTPPRDGPLTIVYTGRLYPRQDPTKLLTAIAALRAVDVQVQARFVGRYLGSVREVARALGLHEDSVRVDEPVSHRDALVRQRSAHALALFLGDDEDVGWRPAKLYEYLGARRPILMVGGTSAHEARAILAKCGAGTAVTTVDEAATALRAWSDELRTTGQVTYEGDALCVGQFERRALASRLAAVLESVL